MGATYSFEREKLVIGVIFHDEDVLNEVLGILTDKFGRIDAVSEEYSFSEDYSTYYDGELGGEGRRRIYSFEELVDPSLQAEIKEYTNELEKKFSSNGGRRINLDPGLMSHGRFMLSTTKNASFRIPLKRGIYTEMTLFYARGAWRKLLWTYMDYQSETVLSFLEQVRKKYLKQRRDESAPIPLEENYKPAAEEKE